MPDGDIFDVHTPRWWHTAARRVYEGDPRALPSMLRSIQKTLRDRGGFPGLSEIAEVVRIGCTLADEGRQKARNELVCIERDFLHSNTSYAISLANSVLANPQDYLGVKIPRAPHEFHELFAGVVLVEYAIDQISNERLAYEVAVGKGIGRKVQEYRLAVARRELFCSPDLADLAKEALAGCPRTKTRVGGAKRQRESQAELLSLKISALG